MQAVIRPHPSRNAPADYDKHAYKERHLVEEPLLDGRGTVAHRDANRTATVRERLVFLAMVYLGCIKEWLF